MKPNTNKGVFLPLMCILFLVSTHLTAESGNSERQFACYADAALNKYLAEVFGSEIDEYEGKLLKEEIIEVDAVLNDDRISDHTSQEKFTAVMHACATGQILDNRFGHLIQNN